MKPLLPRAQPQTQKLRIRVSCPPRLSQAGCGLLAWALEVRVCFAQGESGGVTA